MLQFARLDAGRYGKLVIEVIEVIEVIALLRVKMGVEL